MEKLQGKKRKNVGKKKNLPKGASPMSGVIPPIDKRWVKGQSGNPKGRPPLKLSLTSKLRRRMFDIAPPEVVESYWKNPKDRRNKQWLDVYIEAALYAATDKNNLDSALWKEIIARLEGKTPEFALDRDLAESEVAEDAPEGDRYAAARDLLKRLAQEGILPLSVFASFMDSGDEQQEDQPKKRKLLNITPGSNGDGSGANNGSG